MAKLDFMKMKNFHTAKNFTDKVKSNPQKGKHICKISDEGLISRIYKISHNSAIKKQTIKLKGRQRTRTDISP